MIRHAQSLKVNRKPRGFSLIEVLVALVITMILLLGMATMLMETSDSHRELSKQSRQIENGTYAMLKLGDDLKHAGYYGLYSSRGASNPAAFPDPCADKDTANYSAVLKEAIKLPVQGYDNPNPAAAPVTGCISGHIGNTDILVIRRVNTNFGDIDIVDDTSTRLYLQSTADGVEIATGNTDPSPFTLEVTTATPPDIVKNTNTPPLAPVFEYFTHIYYVRLCTGCGLGGENVPILYRASLNENGLFANEPLVDGIEQFQVEYGLDTSGNGAPDVYVADPANPLPAGETAIGRWRQVVAVRLYILARNTEETRTDGYTDQKTYNLGAFGNYTPADNFKRHLFTSTFKLMNL